MVLNKKPEKSGSDPIIKLVIKELRRQLDGNGLKAKLLRGGVGSIMVKIAGTGLGFLLVVVLARTLGSEGYGIYTFALVLTSLAAIPAQLGLPNLLVRETAKAATLQQWGLLRGLWRWSTLAVFITSIIIALLAMAGIWVFGDVISKEQHTTILIGLLLVPLVGLGSLRSAALRGLGRVVLGQVPDSILRPIILILLVAITALISGLVSPVITMWLHIVTATIVFMVGAWILHQSSPDELRIKPKPQYDSRIWLASALPLAMISGMQFVNSQIDIIMLGVIRGPQEVGIYKVVVSALVLVTFGLQVVNTVIAPHFASLHAQGDKIRLQKAVTMGARASLVMALPVALLLFLSGDYLLAWIFGVEFANGHVALNILIFGQLMNISMGLTSSLLMMTGYESYALKTLLLAVISNVILNAILVPTMGMVGAAVATVIALVIWKVYMTILVRRHLGIHACVV